MANPKKNTKQKAASKPEPAIPANKKSIISRRQARLGFGMFFLLTGLFVCFSIISYCLTWQNDQSIAQKGWKYAFNSEETVENLGGRLGAVIGHVLVFDGAGIASLVIGFLIIGIGLNLIYGKRVIAVNRYLRWFSILLLVAAPVLAYLLPDTEFRYGGTLGVESVDYMNGLFGNFGTGFVLLGLVCFVAFVVFSLDITPILRRAKRTANAVAANLKPVPVTVQESAEAPVTEEDMSPVAIIEDIPAETVAPLADMEEENGEEWDMTLSEKTEETGNEQIETPEEINIEEELPRPVLAEQELSIPEPAKQAKTAAAAEPEFSIEVIHREEERVTIQHGAHVSIGDNEPYAPELDLPDYKFPTLDLLEDRSQESITFDKDELEKNKNQIIQTLRSFSIEIQRISATVGPTVTLYEIVPAEGVRISKIRNLEDDIALSLAALGIRIIAPIPGRGTIGIEVPNANKQIVSMRTLLSSEKFVNSKMSLPIALGKKIDNENYIVDLATMPHLLVAGATGQGKSVGINAILVSLLYKKHPAQLKFVMVDPKKVELSIYRTIEKHFLAKLPNEEEAIITDTKKVIYTLNALCIEMDNRYELLKEAGARNIKEYNEKFINRRLNPEKGHKYLPFIVLVIDEFADLIMTAGKEVEMPIARLAQLARAIGIHLIIATQRPSVNVITGTIKANFPGRIAFKVSAKVDSRTILDAGGAEQLIGRGDMLVSHGSELMRLQCAFVDTPEVENVVEFIGKQRGYPSAFELPEYEGEDGENDKIVDLTNRDKLFEDCARIVVQTQNGSTSNLQRRLNLGYNRAGRIMDQLEASGIVGPAVGSKPRDVLFKTEAELEQFFNNNLF